MRRWFFRSLCGGILIVHSALAHARHLTLNQFQTRMRAQLASLTKHTSAGVYIEVLGTGQRIFSHLPDQSLMPASASKLITTSAALERLGPGFQYETHVLTDNNDLVLMSGGDPYILIAPFTQLAQDVAALGIRHVHSIRINNSSYVEDYVGLSEFANWDAEDDASIVSATSFNYNVLQIFVTPESDRMNVSLGPVVHNGYPIIKNSATLVDGSGHALSIRPLGVVGEREAFEITGTIGRQAGKVELHAAVRNPESNVAYAFAGLLRDLGVAVDQDYGGATFSPPSASERVIASVSSLTLLELANIYMPDSINFMAEGVFQTYGSAEEGGPASLAKSQVAISAFLKKFKYCQSAEMENGSGLTWNNKVSPHCFIDVIQSLYRRQPLYDDLIGSLPIGGKTGTLANRFQNAPKGFDASKVHAKTGSLWSKEAVTDLIGETEIAGGQKVLFAFMENDDRNEEGTLYGLKDWEDSCVEILQELEL